MDSALDMLIMMRYTNLRFIIIIIINGVTLVWKVGDQARGVKGVGNGEGDTPQSTRTSWARQAENDFRAF